MTGPSDSPAGSAHRRAGAATLVCLLLLGATTRAQDVVHLSDRCVPSLRPRATGGPQIADTAFHPRIAPPAYPPGTGPRVLLDEAHHNFHTIDGRYAPFARLLRADGYVVRPLRSALTAGSLAGARVLVVANAVAERNAGGNWTLPTPSAFTASEVAVVRHWVDSGGSLLLIADHMPFGGAAENLAVAFGTLITNGYATDESCSADEFLFSRANTLLADHPITRGRRPDERVTEVRTFTGQAFRVIAPGAAPLLTLAPTAMLLLPSKAWEFDLATPRIPAGGMLQGVAIVRGRGRVAVFGEAAMFSAQVSGAARRPMGMNAPDAAQNARFLLNVMHWLTGLLPVR